MDPMLKRQSVIVVVIVAAFFVLTFIFNIWNGSEPPVNTPPLAASSTQNDFLAFKSGTGLPKLPLPKPDVNALRQNSNLPKETIPFFERISSATDQVEKKIISELGSTTTTKSATATTSGNIAISPQTSQKEITLNLTDDEFHYLYPKNFIDSLLGGTQNFMKDNDPSYSPVHTLTSDKEIRQLQEKLLAIAVASKQMTQEEADGALTTIRFTLPQLQLESLAQRKQAMNSPRKILAYIAKTPEFIAAFYQSNPKPKQTNLRSALIDTLEKFGKIPTANAVCGGCANYPECFKEGAVFGPPPGQWMYKFVCSCWGCYEGLGCLDNATCGPGIAAIWDGPGGINGFTSICGCGV